MMRPIRAMIFRTIKKPQKSSRLTLACRPLYFTK
jgi:hypothetical protein